MPRSGEQFEKFVAVKKSFPGARAIARPEYFLVADAAAGARAGGGRRVRRLGRGESRYRGGGGGKET